MATLEVNLMCDRYERECTDFPPRFETEQEKRQRLLRDKLEQEKKERAKTMFLDYKERRLNGK
jgi:hypothetical protein